MGTGDVDVYNLRRRAWNQGYQTGTEHVEKNTIDIAFALLTSKSYGDQCIDFINGYASAVSDGCRRRIQADRTAT